MTNKKNYRVSFILDMRGYSEPVDTIFAKLKNTVTDVGGIIKDFKPLGQKVFERAVDKKFPSGEYVQIYLEGDSGVPAAIRGKLRLDKTINRVFIENC
ncbi:MAG: 30S ribosomal protein S6 [Puniceicoccales bacterium]|jgi:ribosomal protein S6|nr:30S ribosomal protein S6 [Puniceicoccales bacterium]